MPLLYLAQLLFQAKLCFLLNNFSAVVVTAVTANPVRCLILSPHCGHFIRAGALSFHTLERLLFCLALDTFLLGTAIVSTSLY